MHVKKIQKKLDDLFNQKVKIEENEYSYILSGNLDNYEDVLTACKMAVNKKSNKHVVNHINFPCKKEIIHIPDFENKELDNLHVDCLIIGAGISGCSIARELSRYNMSILLVDKEADVANQASSRNDGEIHPGVDLNKGSLKQSLVVEGNRLYDKITSELGVDFKRVGQIACFTQKILKPAVRLMCLQRKYVCHVDDTKYVNKKEIQKLLPHINKDVCCGIYNPMAGIVSPYNLTIAYCENAITNGVKVSLNTYVKDMVVSNNQIEKVITNKGIIYPTIVINAAGVFSDTIAKMANDEFFSIHPRKGTIIITDKKENYLNDMITSIKEINGVDKKNHSKGGGIIRTIHDNLLVGPDAIETYLKEDFSTSSESINNIYKKQTHTMPELNRRNIITYFAGIRASNFEEDFVIENGHNTKNIIHVGAIQSPGLTTAPAVANLVKDMAYKMLSNYKNVDINPNFNPIRKKPVCLKELDEKTKDKLIKENPLYGEIVCRCEQISKGEIIDALNRPLHVPTIDGIKRRVRPGMGRCQGSFCMPLVASIIAENENIEIKDVKKSSANLCYRDSKEEN